MIIEVTQDCIDNGTPRSNRGCPVALAVRAAIPNIYACFVGVSFIWFRDKDYLAHNCPTPPEVARFIGAVDAGCVVEPFTFELDTTLT